MNRRIIVCFLVVLSGSYPIAARAVVDDRVGYAVVDGAIGPATADYLARASRVAGQRGDACLIIRLDTPGGLLDATQQIVQALLRLAGAGRGLRVAVGCQCRQRRLLHHAGRRRGGDGPAHEHRRGASRVDRRNRRRRGRAGRRDEGEAGEFRHELHRGDRPQARTQRRMGPVLGPRERVDHQRRRRWNSG